MAHTGSRGDEERVGPTSAVAARTGIGLRSPRALRIERPAGVNAATPALYTLTLSPGTPAVPNDHRPASGRHDEEHGQHLAGHTVAPGEELSWAWFPEHCLPPGVSEPREQDLDRFWDATAFSLDVVFDDGSRLSEQTLDQYGTRLTPTAQEDARMQWVDQWNLRRVDLSAYVGRTIARVEATLGRPADHPGAAQHALSGWLDAVRITSATPPAETALDHVRTTRGTHSSDRFSRGNNAPLVAVPHGGVFGLPMTDASDNRWPYSYHAHVGDDARPRIQAFATSHIPSPWMGDRGVFQIMPSPSPLPDSGRHARALAFDHDTESDRPDEYSVRLEGGITAQMTAADFALGMRFTFAQAEQSPQTRPSSQQTRPSSQARPAPQAQTPEQGRAAIILDHHGTVDAARVTLREGCAVIDAHLNDRPGTPPHFIHARIFGAVTDQTRYTSPDENDEESGRLDGWITVDTTSPVDVLIGISTVSAADAAANLEAAGSVDVMRAAATRRWHDALGTLQVEGATDDQLVSVFSGLYRLFLYPNRADETARDGTARHRSPYADVLEQPIRSADAECQSEIVEGPFATTNGFWDTYRTAWPLLGLLSPERAGELATGFVRHAADGGWVPRWSAPGAEDVMTGTTSDTVFADLLVKGVPGLDLEAAYRTARTNATVPSRDPRVGRKGLLPGAFRGYVDTETPEGMSWTLDAAINDWGVAVMARMLRDRHRAKAADTEAADTDETDAEPAGTDAAAGDAAERYDAEYEWFARRSLLYREVFDSETGFFRGRRPDGSWREEASRFDPDQWGHDYTETNAWGTMFTVPHDGAGLAALHGGESGLRAAVDRFSAARETGSSDRSGSYGFAIHEMIEARDIRMGTLGMSNQPAHHIPFIPMFSGDHDRAHKIVRECLQRLFVGSDLGQGYPGDEDNGEMSAWYIFATIGLYPLAPATGSYVLVPPSVRRSVLQVAGGTTIIEVDGACSGSYISSVTVDGEPWDQISIPHEVVTSGVNIVFTLSETPCGWARRSRPASASALHGFADVPRDLLPRRASCPSGEQHTPSPEEADAACAALTDDTGATRVTLHAGQSIHVPLLPGAASLYTVTVADPTRASWTMEIVDADGTVLTRDARRDEHFDWPGQTRVFRLAQIRQADGSAAAGGYRTVRFTAADLMTLTQLEVIAASA